MLKTLFISLVVQLSISQVRLFDSWHFGDSTSMWQKPLTYLIIGCFLLAIMFITRRYELTRLKLRNQMRMARLESSKLKELDQRKSQFFANISHEFRTPLTLIKGPLEQLMEDSENSQNHRIYQQMHTNTSRLLQLINQLLDLSRLEAGMYELKAAPGEVIRFLEGLVMSFASTADQRKITLTIETGPELNNPRMNSTFYYDADILEKICNNLLSNAFKFSPDNGSIKVKLTLVCKEDSRAYLEISFEDQGIGIPVEVLPHIFDRFYQLENSGNVSFESSGIGLAYVNELVRIHHGEIEVTSQVGTGSTFTVRFPMGKSHLSSDQLTESIQIPKNIPAKAEMIGIDNREGPNIENDSLPLVLIIEDHSEVREYIRDCIKHQYRVLMASNAQEGLVVAHESVPDLIICDVMMPELDGFRFCHKIKTNIVTSHIPVILVTARADMESKIEGLETGADEYLTKPFHAKELQLRIKNQIAIRLALRQKFSNNTIIKPSEISVSSQDADFIEKLMKLVETNIDNVNFSVELLGKEAGMSQSQLHRKLKSTVNMSSNHFIRSIRMHRAMELLQKGTGNISEIAYSVGYEDPGYFSKTFRKFFGKLPSDLQKTL